MKIENGVSNDFVVQRFKGRAMGGLDYDNMRNSVKQLIDEGHRRFVWDFSELTWVNSSGMGIFVSAWHTIRKSGGALAVVLPLDNAHGKAIDNVLNITMLKLVFEIYEDLDSAITAVRNAKIY